MSNVLLFFPGSFVPHLNKDVRQVILSTDIGDVDYVEVQPEDFEYLTNYHGVRGVPSLILLDKYGEELKRHTGLLSSVGLQNFVGYDPDALDDQEEEPISLKEPWKETW